MATSQEYTISRKVSDTEEEIIQIPYGALANKPDLSVYQTKNDASLETNDKTVVGAINEVVTGVAETLESFGMSLAPQENGKLNKKVYVCPDGYFSQGTSYDASKDLYLSIGDGLALETIDEANNIWNIKSGSAIISVDGLGGGAISGNVSTSGSLTVGGSLTVNGTTTTVDSTTLQVKDKLIEVAHGNTTALTTPAGLVAPKYDGTNSGALVFDSTGTAYVGDVKLDSTGNIDVAKSELQPLATRTGLVGGNLVQYDSTAQTLKDSGKKISDLATTSQLPTVNNGTLTIQKNGTTVATFSANQSGNATANITVPTKVSELTNDSGYTTNKGTVTSVAVKMNGATKGTVTSSGTIDLGTVLTSHQDISGKANLSGGNTFSGQQIFLNTNRGAVAECVVNNTAGDSFTVRSISDNTQKTAISNGYVWCQDSDSIYSQFKATGIYYGNDTSGYEGTLKFPTNISGEKTIATTDQIPDISGLMPKTGGTFTGDISVPKTITFTDETNPFIKMRTGGTDFYFQSTSGQFGLGPTWNKATHWDANGNVTFPTVPKVGSSSLALKSDIPTFSLSGTTLTITL